MDKQEGHTDISHGIIEALAQTYLSSYESQVIFAILRKTVGWHKNVDKIPNSQLVSATGIHKAHVSRTLSKLKSRRIVTQTGNKIGIQTDTTKWIKQMLPKQVTTKLLPKQVTGVTQTGNKKLPKQADSKDNKDIIQNNVSTNADKINYFADLIAKELGDDKSLAFYKQAVATLDPHRLLQKAKEIVKDGGAKKPGAVFTAWYLEEARKLLVKSM